MLGMCPQNIKEKAYKTTVKTKARILFMHLRPFSPEGPTEDSNCAEESSVFCHEHSPQALKATDIGHSHRRTRLGDTPEQENQRLTKFFRRAHNHVEIPA